MMMVAAARRRSGLPSRPSCTSTGPAHRFTFPCLWGSRASRPQTTSRPNTGTLRRASTPVPRRALGSPSAPGRCERRSSRDGGEPARAELLLYGNQLDPFGSVYRKEPDFRGYTIAYQQLAVGRRVQGLRLSLGIDFLAFPAYSTGLITMLGGVGVDLVRTPGGAVTLRAVPQGGTAIFVEGRQGYARDLLAQLGLEATVRLGG